MIMIIDFNKKLSLFQIFNLLQKMQLMNLVIGKKFIIMIGQKYGAVIMQVGDMTAMKQKNIQKI